MSEIPEVRSAEGRLVRHGSLTLDLAIQTATRREIEISLTLSEFRLLTILLTNCGTSYSKDQLGVALSYGRVTNAIYQLRKKLADQRTGGRPADSIIKTTKGRYVIWPENMAPTKREPDDMGRIVSYGRLILNTRTRTADLYNLTENLSKIECDLLAILLSNQDKEYTNKELHDTVFQDAKTVTHATARLRYHIGGLLKKLGRLTQAGIIETLKKTHEKEGGYIVRSDHARRQMRAFDRLRVNTSLEPEAKAPATPDPWERVWTLMGQAEARLGREAIEKFDSVLSNLKSSLASDRHIASDFYMRAISHDPRLAPAEAAAFLVQRHWRTLPPIAVVELLFRELFTTPKYQAAEPALLSGLFQNEEIPQSPERSKPLRIEQQIFMGISERSGKNPIEQLHKCFVGINEKRESAAAAISEFYLLAISDEWGLTPSQAIAFIAVGCTNLSVDAVVTILSEQFLKSPEYKRTPGDEAVYKATYLDMNIAAVKELFLTLNVNYQRLSENLAERWSRIRFYQEDLLQCGNAVFSRKQGIITKDSQTTALSPVQAAVLNVLLVHETALSSRQIAVEANRHNPELNIGKDEVSHIVARLRGILDNNVIRISAGQYRIVRNPEPSG